MINLTVVTAGHIVSTPRMLKAADAFCEAGHRVHMVSSEHVDWCIKAGNQVKSVRPWSHASVNWSNTSSRLYRISRWRHKIARTLASVLPESAISLSLAANATCRVAPELIRKTTERPADFIYAGTAGGVAVAALAARKMNVPFAVDLEDLHTAERPPSTRARTSHRLMYRVEREVLHEAAFCSTSSKPIATALEQQYGIQPAVIHNVSSLPTELPNLSKQDSGKLRVIWFSQQIGPGRGLEDLVPMCKRIGRPLHIGLLGSRTQFSDHLADEIEHTSPNVRVEFLPHCSPDEMVEVCRQWDVGLALEPGFSPNNSFALSNKMTTYMTCGLAIAATETAGQREPANELGPGVFYYQPRDAAALADGLRHWADDKVALLQAKRASWEAAVKRWNWDHPLEKGALVDAVARVVGRQQTICASC